MKRLAVVLIAVVTMSACTPSEIAAWQTWMRKDPAAARAELAKLKTEVNQPVPSHAPMGSKCPGWFDEAMSAGFSFDQWRTVDRIMWRESRCQEGAHNRAGANGLMQLMAMWADDCGTTVAGLRQGAINLRCARHVLAVQGWDAWSTY